MVFTSHKDTIRNNHVSILYNEFNNDKLSRQIEQQLYNMTIRVAKERFI